MPDFSNTVLVSIRTYDASGTPERVNQPQLAVSFSKNLWRDNPTGEARTCIMETVRERVNEALGIHEDRPKPYLEKRTDA